MSKVSIQTLLNRYTQILSEIPDAYFEVECLLAHLLTVDRLFLKKNPDILIEPSVQKTLNQQVLERKAGKPLAYIIGKKAFWTFQLTVTPAVLVPRADTECLVEMILQTLPERLPHPVVDLGTGSGAIALALATERPLWKIIATDLSKDALLVAKKNAHNLSITNIDFYEGSWFEPLKEKGLFSAIVSNPPYIPESDPHLLHPSLQMEPYSALCSGKSGLEAFIKIIEGSKQHLVNNGLLCLEHGHDQSMALSALLKKQGYVNQQQFVDLGNNPRVVTARWCF